MNKQKNKDNKKEYQKQIKVIERKIKNKISRMEAKLLLHVLIYDFDGFARQQQLIIEHMSSRFHWGNKRTIRVLKTIAAIGVVDRWKSKADNWSLFYLIKGFFETCKNRIKRAGKAIKQRVRQYRHAIFLISRKEKDNTLT